VIARRRLLALTTLMVAAVPLVAAQGASATPPAAHKHLAVASSKTETITRNHLVGGVDQVADTRTVTVNVAQTTALRDRQQIAVTWSGAHPTGGLVADVNSAGAAQEEYPVVLLECRGVDSTSVPVSQQVRPETCWTSTSDERYQVDNAFQFPPFRVDRFATPANRVATVGQPATLPAACGSAGGGFAHWVHFVATDGKDYPGGPFGCAGIPPEAVQVQGAFQPSNTTYGISDGNGSGSASFLLQTSETNASMGCSDKVACALVAVPVMGISCDTDAALLPPEDQPGSAAAAAFAECSATGKYLAGEPGAGGNQENLAVSGLLWWSASNWRNRITFPLHFAQPSNVCSVLNTSAPTFVYGSELITQATLQWAPSFCLSSKLFKFQHVQTSDPEAKNLLATGSIQAAFQAQPPAVPFDRPTVQAPVAVSGFAIVYAIDDKQGHVLSSLRLTPRLLAKLLTESYPSNPSVQTAYSALANNPTDIGLDPEFRALNPGTTSFYATEPASTLLALSSDSDVMWALTAYINADPEARAFLDGKADPWGMRVNPSYKGISLPTASWPLLDTFVPKDLENSVSCLSVAPIPWLPLVSAPVSAMSTISLDMQFDVANSQVNCLNSGQQNQKLGPVGREATGQRFVLGITSLGDANRFALATASLEAQTSASAPDAFTDATGRTFVAASDDSLRAAVKMMTADRTANTWLLPYDKLRSDAAGAQAYPGTLLVSMDVPTSGLPKTEAANYASMLRFFVGTGQTPGFGNGQLPPGFLPLTAANGGAAFVSYSGRAATAVAAQHGDLPLVTGGQVAGAVVVTPTGTGGGTGSGAPLPSPGSTSGGTPSTSPSPVDNVSSPRLVPLGATLGAKAGLGGLALPLVLLLALLGAVAAPLTRLVARVRGRS
jgi:hypothetical protein